MRIVVFVGLALFAIAAAAEAQDRGGFTALVDVGVGVQHDRTIKKTEVGLAGLNLGVGGFLTRDLAVMFRIVGVNASYDLGAAGYYRQVSGVGGASLQYWVSNRFNIEAGAGWGFWSVQTDEEAVGLGLIVGAAVSIFNRGKHNLQFGVLYAPAFTDPAPVHNVGFTFGYQFQ